MSWLGETTANPVPNSGRLYESHLTSNTMNSWTWKIDRSLDPTMTATFYAKCLSKYVPLSGSEKHKLIYRYQSDNSQTVGVNSIDDIQLSCTGAYKLIVAGFTITDKTHAVYMGMDPRPITRNFRFYGNGFSDTPVLDGICLNYRTT